ncbi:DUF3644 domain-containing protein [Amycolatopsis japonica]|uniref:DUF3644 domain-containing protein n=1 Tax=Amycolatopsis japonica TaxID=208439 RepID=UPI0033CCF47F
MNYRGSSRRLLSNSISAMLAAIEIYNKPRLSHRNEIVSILLINAWELLLKAIISKSKQSIYYKKSRNQPYKTLSLQDASKVAAESSAWPGNIDSSAVSKNIDLLTLYRNQSVHFYNESDFGIILYSLAQTAILNFRDVATAVFKKDIADEITWQILPLSVRTPVDPIKYLKGSGADSTTTRSGPVHDFLLELKNADAELRAKSSDTNRLLTIFSVSLQSVKKISESDIVVGIDNDGGEGVIVSRRVDPNISHPYRMKDLLPKLRPELEVRPFEFLAITTVRNMRTNPTYCWESTVGKLVRWSPETVTAINRLSRQEVVDACAELKKKKARK